MRDVGSSPLARGKRATLPGGCTSQRLIPARAGKTGCPTIAPTGRQAHPRSRGENILKCGCFAVATGSSPLARGKRRGPAVRVARGRLIPARAGKTGSGGGHLGAARAHPRSRGENIPHDDTGVLEPGSSPLARGKRRRLLRDRRTSRLIPARAGKTTPPKDPNEPSTAHPRSRGENRRPPGTPRQSGRLIPARAGKTTRFTPSCATASAHPRSRGENRSPQQFAESPEGSSPLARGKPVSGRVARRSERLIPARAGKTPIPTGTSRAHSAHPRSRGENCCPGLDGRATRGSSPLARGKLTIRHHLNGGAGLIPARAGKTLVFSSTANHPWAHPRSRGENYVQTTHCVRPAGSSPLARGKRPGAQQRLGAAGLIPARAGKTTPPTPPPTRTWAHPRSRGENDTDKIHLIVC